jgi:hypothetical protein
VQSHRYRSASQYEHYARVLGNAVRALCSTSGNGLVKKPRVPEERSSKEVLPQRSELCSLRFALCPLPHTLYPNHIPYTCTLYLIPSTFYPKFYAVRRKPCASYYPASSIQHPVSRIQTISPQTNPRIYPLLHCWLHEWHSSCRA